MRKQVLLLILFVFLSACASTQLTKTERTQGMVVGTIHSNHLTTPEYPLSSLGYILDNFLPDLILVEIRLKAFSAGLLEDGIGRMLFVSFSSRLEIVFQVHAAGKLRAIESRIPRRRGIDFFFS